MICNGASGPGGCRRRSARAKVESVAAMAIWATDGAFADLEASVLELDTKIDMVLSCLSLLWRHGRQGKTF